MRKCIRDIMISTAAVLVIGAIAWGSQVSAASFLEECKVEHHKDNLIKNGYAKDGDKSNWTGLVSVLKDTHNGNFFFVLKGGKRKNTYSHLFPVDSTKAYELSGWFKATAPEVNLVFGLFVYNKEKRFISSLNINEVKGTLTELIAPCEPDSKVLKVKDASKWKESPPRRYVVAFAPKKDLPNFNITKVITLVEKTDNGYLVHLSKPCGFKYPAGTKIVQTKGSSNGIYVAVVPVPGKWTKFSGIIKGEIKALSMKNWWSGTEYARVTIISKFRDENAELLFDNIVIKQVNPK